MHPSDNRRSFRIVETVYLAWDELSEEDFRFGIQRYKMRKGLDSSATTMLLDIDARLSEAMFMLNGESPVVGRVLKLLSEKLDVVVGQLPCFIETRSALAHMPSQKCELSADGMVFASDKQMPVGTKLHVRFLLESDNRFLETFAKVVRHVDPPAENPELPHGHAIEFSGMKSEQREILIQYMFSRESKTLRKRRLEQEAAEQEQA